MADLPFTLTAQVIHGDKTGRTLGFPTANLDVSAIEVALEAGVYAGVCQVGRHTYHCLPYWGPRYIKGEMLNSFEVHILDFEGDLYDQQLSLTALAFIRPPVPFESEAALKKQLQADVEAVKKFFRTNLNLKTGTLSI